MQNTNPLPPRAIGYRESEEYTPTEKLEICPECGASLEHENPIGHAESHWPTVQRQNGISKEAQERYDLLVKEAERRGK